MLRWIIAAISKRGFPPTTREVCAGMGWSSTNGATYHLRRLYRTGLLRRTRGAARGLVVTESGYEMARRLP